MNTRDFKTKTLFIARKNIAAEQVWPTAIDIGYSAVKGMSPNKVFAFPSYAREIDLGSIIGSPNPTDILYRGEDGKTWCIGEKANSMINDIETGDSEEILYGRNRYFQPMFRVIAQAALGISLMENEYGKADGLPYLLQTGLPTEYLETDSDDLKDALYGRHVFSLKIGAASWKDFNLNLERKNIEVMEQPKGSMFGASIKNNGSPVADARNYLSKNTLVCDPGFDTFDVFSVRAGNTEFKLTFDDLGMKEIFLRTVRDIYDRYKIKIQIHALQKYLAEGKFIKFDKRTMQRTKIPFDEILARHTKEVCLEALDRIKPIFNYFMDVDYFLVTGGTGAAWKGFIIDYFKDMEGLKVISGNQNDSDLSNIFSNVRGYYLFLVSNLRRKQA